MPGAALVPVALWVLAGCAGLSPVDGAGDNADEVQTVTDEIEGTASSSEDGQIGLSPEDDLLGQVAMAQYAKARSVAMAQCMTSAGFPQLEEVIAYEDEAGIDLRLYAESLENPLIDFHPINKAEAEFGYQPPSSIGASVRSSSAGYGSSLSSCRSEAEDPESEWALAQHTQVLDQVYNEWLEAIGSDAFGDVAGQWIGCMEQAGYLVVDEEALWEGDMLTAFNVEGGVWSGDGESLGADQLGENETRVEYPKDRRYQPSSQELALALEDVRCKTTTDFLRYILDAHQVVVDLAIAEHGAEIETARETFQKSTSGN